MVTEFTGHFIMIPQYRAPKFRHRLTRAIVSQHTQQCGGMAVTISLSQEGEQENIIFEGSMTSRAVRRLVRRLENIQHEQPATTEVMIFITNREGR